MSVTAPRRRLLVLLVAMAVGFTGLVWRLADVQGISAERYDVFGESQRLAARELPAHRGSIFDRNGSELAISLPRRTVSADPSLIDDPAATARALAPVLGLDEVGLIADLTADTRFTYLARRVEEDVATRVAELDLTGVFFIDEAKRFLPAGSLAAPVLGQVGDEGVGLSGLELQFDEQLTGTPGELLVERDVNGNEIAGGVKKFDAPDRGESLVLTIDQAMQYETERVLGEQIAASGAKGGIAAVMDPRTGEILALANLLSADEGKVVEPSPDNMAVTRVYEPGSVSKVVTVAAAVEEGLVSGDTFMSVPDTYEVSDGEFSDIESHDPVYWSVDQIIAESSNVGAIMIGEKVGRDRMYEYIDSFGLVDSTGLGFPGESGGIIPEPENWSGTSIATVAIGQGVAVTALQMLGAYNVIANGGTYVAPRLVRGVAEPSGELRSRPSEPGRRVVSEETAAEVTEMLVGVVNEGTGTGAAVQNYEVAGKTGTSRKAIEGAPGYVEGAYVASFAGFLPASSPRLTAIVVLDEPEPYYGGVVAAPVFAQLAETASRLFGVAPHPSRDAPLSTSASRDLPAVLASRSLAAGTLGLSPPGA